MDKRVVAAALLMAAVFGLAFGALLEGGGGQSRAATSTPIGTPSPGRKIALPTPTASMSDRPSPDYGFAAGVVERSGATYLVFDRADILLGAQATAEAARNGTQVDPDGGYYVRNNNKRQRQLRIADSVQIRGGRVLTGTSSERSLSLEELAVTLDDANDPVPVLLSYDDDGRIATIAETTLP